MRSHLPCSRLIPALALILSLVFTGLTAATTTATMQENSVSIAIHGGAGTIRRADMTPEREQAYREKMEEALRAGHAILTEGGSSLDAVEATIRILEDSPLFNAGKGAVLTTEGVCELDASVMVGDTLAAGAIAGATRVKNPITAAKAVMQQTSHVLLAGPAVNDFAEQVGLEIVDNEYFLTDPRKEALDDAKNRENDPGATGPILDDSKYGTVGCVALDQAGNLAAGTSTGGITNKKYGRVGDSPIIGAGTWAENETAAVSCTGQGEFFIRLQVAGDIAARMRYGNISFRDAVAVQMDRIGSYDALGGLVAMDGDGNVAFTFNTEGMYRGQIGPDGELKLAIYDDDEDRIEASDLHKKP